MNRTPASRFGEPAEADLPDDIREIYETNRKKIGFVPNVFRAYAKRPEHFRAFMTYHDVLMKGPSNLARAEREAIVVAVSSENRCQYCMTAHGAAPRILGKDPILAEQIANNWQTADLTPRLRAMLAFASYVNEPGFAATDEDIVEMHEQGTPTMTSGISRRSPHSLDSRIAWPALWTCDRIPSSIRWGARSGY
jgi:uncharacterized peroxidase-related enzyme